MGHDSMNQRLGLADVLRRNASQGCGYGWLATGKFVVGSGRKHVQSNISFQ